MALTDDAALRNLSQFVNIMTSQGLQQSPEKLAGLDDIMQNVVNTIPQFAGMPDLMAQNDSSSSKPTASSSSGSTSPRDETMEDPESNSSETSAPATTNAVGRQYRLEPWHECFTTTQKPEFDALIYSVYVIQRDDRKLDGYDYFECINRLQNKCRYKVRTKKVNEFFIVEEKGAHNHAMEPVGSPGSHAGLPKTLREIVDSSFHNDWPNTMRQQKIEEEVKRLGLPHNPRLGRQIDNRIAYLRRVKNLTEMRKLQDQLPGSAPSVPSLENGVPPPSGGSPDEILRFMMQMHQNSAPTTESTISPPQLAPMAPLPTTPVNNSEIVPPQMQQPPLLTQQSPLVIHDGNNEIMKMLMQAKDGGQDPAQILQMLAPFLPPQALQQQLQDSSRSTQEGRLHIEDQ